MAWLVIENSPFFTIVRVPTNSTSRSRLCLLSCPFHPLPFRPCSQPIQTQTVIFPPGRSVRPSTKDAALWSRHGRLWRVAISKRCHAPRLALRTFFQPLLPCCSGSASDLRIVARKCLAMATRSPRPLPTSRRPTSRAPAAPAPTRPSRETGSHLKRRPSRRKWMQ